ncbi:hypothetical protein L3Q82_021646 [Scortum barcoo]|uniref:Uncharacterized protein n=1 Tax=Scortum barcoo TaxID=214431 RepID=A0ACB8X5V2_9TELE|nr:hypothetical protein L3Q82_021646 [Scortum barcoo]
MGLLRVMMPPKLQLLALLAFAVAMFFLENQIQKLEESRGKLVVVHADSPQPLQPPGTFSTPSTLEQQLRVCGSGMAPSVTRSSFDEWNINSCSGGYEGESGGFTHDILIGLRCQMPASEARLASPGRNSVSAARQGFRQGFRSPLAPLSAPTGIRTSHRQTRGARDRAAAHAGRPAGTGLVGLIAVPRAKTTSSFIYNRVPKTASTSFTNIAYDLCGKNHYHVLHINTTKNNPVMSIQDQVRFVKNVTEWREMKPAFYHGHVSFLDFTKFGVKRKPIYINVIRDPIERLVSYYYFLRFGDDYRPGLRRRKQGDKKTFDECVSAGGSDCAPEKLWLQIPFFCGHYSECWNVGSQWALEQAKYNLVNEYMLVGVTEELEDFVMMLEAAHCHAFSKEPLSCTKQVPWKKSHLRKTSEKKPPTKESIAKLQQSAIWKMENEFYEFALEQFQFVRAHAVREKDGELYLLTQNFFYEKIYPKN